MASDLAFVEYACEQMSGAGAMSFRKMFGEYAVYCNTKVVALVCDNQLFVKITDAGKKLLGDAPVGSPYPNAKPWFLMDDLLDNRDALGRLITVTERDLPRPKPKAPKATKGTKAVKAVKPPKTAKAIAAAKKPKSKKS